MTTLSPRAAAPDASRYYLRRTCANLLRQARACYRAARAQSSAGAPLMAAYLRMSGDHLCADVRRLRQQLHQEDGA